MMTRLSHLDITFYEEGANNLSHSQIELDNALSRFSEEASNPITLASMTLGCLAFQGTRSALLALRGFQNPILRTSFSYTGALAAEVTVFRASNTLLNPSSVGAIHESPLQEIFDPKSWFSTALDFGLLKFTGAATGTQNIFLRHAAQDMAMVTGHELGAHLGWTHAEPGTFVEKLFHAEMTNLQMMAGGSLGHVLTGGHIHLLERSLSLQSEVLSHNFTRIEPRWTEPLPTMASTADPTLVPAPIRISLEARLNESPHEWATRLIEHVFHKPEINALHAIDRLYARLRNPATHDHAMEAVHQMEELTRKIPEGENLLVRRYEVAGIEKPLLLVSLPTTFLPEAWSKTFVDGLAGEHQAHPQTRKLAIEVGSGTGFVSIAIAKLGMADRIIATDRNHHAPLIGRLNAAINGVDNIKFETGNLLNDIPENTQADLIVGCLPQMPSAQASKEIGLRDLADYAEETGAFEDQLGLGLNAKAIDQARTRLSPQGKLRLMMAQRPGLAVVHDLFATRGFAPQIIFSHFIQQDPSTDFGALAKIEAKRGFEFEFRTRDHQVMSATEALGKPRNEIFHYLHLVEATPYPHLMQRTLDEVGPQFPRWAYTEDPGTESPELRDKIRIQFQKIWGLRIETDAIHLAPSTENILEAALRLTVSPLQKVALVGALKDSERKVIHQVPGAQVLELDSDLGNLASELLREAPQAVVMKLPRQLVPNERYLEDIFSVSIRKNIVLIFIEEQGALLHSRQKILLRTLVRYPQALAQSVIIHPLHELFSTPTLPLSAAIIPHSGLRNLMSRYADVTYSRVSTPLQWVYNRFLNQAEIRDDFYWDDLHRREIHSSAQRENLHYTSIAKALESASVFETFPRTSHPDTLDMSFGESEWIPRLDQQAAFSRALSPTRLIDAQQASATYLEEAHGIRFDPSQIVLGSGVHPLLHATLEVIATLHPEQKVELVLPDPSYAMFDPTGIAAGVTPRHVVTQSHQRFLLQASDLEKLPREPGTLRVLLLNQPTNPPGQYYTPEEIRGLARHTDYLLEDDVFAGLSFGDPFKTSDLEPANKASRVIFGGASKEFALGGIRFGFAASSNPVLNAAITARVTLQPDPFATELAISAFSQWQTLTEAHRSYLRERAQALEDFFSSQGFDVLPAQGGFSSFVDLRSILDGKHSLDGHTLTSHNFHSMLLEKAGIKVKSDEWGQVTGYYRFVFSIDRIQDAIERLRNFFYLIKYRE